MKFAKKLLILCVIMAMICVPALADDDVTIDTLLLMFGSANLTVNVDGELSNSLSGTYTPWDIVTVTAPDVTGKNFNYWPNSEGKIISYNAALTLTIYSNTVLNAVYGTGTVTTQPTAEFLSITRSGNQIIFNVMATAQSDITEYGIRYSTTKNTLEALKGNDGVSQDKTRSSITNWLFNVAASDDITYYVTAYVTSGGNTYYSDMKTITLSDLDEGISSIAILIDLLLGVSLDNVSDEVITNLQANFCTVTYDANGGLGTMSPQGFMKNTASALTANTFTRNYYTFTGWNTQANGTGTSYQDEASVTMTANTTLYAQWKPINYTISYDLDGGTVTGNPTSYTIESAAITLNNPTKISHDFAGWTGTDLTEATMTVTISAGSTGNRSYTATYTKINEPEQEPEPSTIILTKLNVSLSADKDSLTLNAGSDDKIVFTVEVSGDYSDNSTKILTSNDYEISWDISPDVTGITIADGILSVSNDSEVGSHDVTITATVGSGDITASADKLITIIINQIVIPETSPDLSPDVTPEPETSPDVTPEPTPTGRPSTPSNSDTSVEMPSQTIIEMDTQELEETLSGGKALVLTENTTTEELNKVIEKFSSLTTSVSVYLSKVESVEEVKIDTAANIGSLIITGNQSIKTVEVTGNTAIKTLNVTGSKVETVDAKGCEALEEVNVEGCESLVSLNVSETSITSLNAKDCKNLNTINCSSCDISDLNLDGCESLNNLDCSNNSLARLNAYNFRNLSRLECRNQHIYGWKRSLTMSLIDLFRGLLFASDVDNESDVANVENLKAYDSSDNEISVEYDKETGDVKFSSLPETFTYDYITGFDNIKMDVTVSAATDNDDDTNDDDIGSSGGGCNSGELHWLLLVVIFALAHNVIISRSKV